MRTNRAARRFVRDLIEDVEELRARNRNQADEIREGRAKPDTEHLEARISRLSALIDGQNEIIVRLKETIKERDASLATVRGGVEGMAARIAELEAASVNWTPE